MAAITVLVVLGGREARRDMSSATVGDVLVRAFQSRWEYIHE